MCFTHCPVTSELTLDPRPELAVQPKESVLFACSGYETNQTIQWLFPDGSIVPTNTTQRIYRQNDTLNIINAVYNDSGVYICRTTDLKTNVTAELKVYDMPSYFIEGMVIVGINAALIILFVSCGIYSFVSSRKQQKKKQKATKYKKTAQSEVV